MTSRDRILTALAHKSPDRVPVDFGARPYPACTSHAWRRCASTTVWSGGGHAAQSVHLPGLVEDDLLAAMGIDTVGVYPRMTTFGYPNEGWKEYRMPWGQVVLVAKDFQTTVDANGIC